MGAEEPTGARGGRARPRSRKGQDVEHPFELDLEDAIRGSVQRLQLRHDGHARTVEVRIPPGVTDGSRVRVPVKAAAAPAARRAAICICACS